MYNQFTTIYCENCHKYYPYYLVISNFSRTIISYICIGCFNKLLSGKDPYISKYEIRIIFKNWYYHFNILNNYSALKDQVYDYYGAESNIVAIMNDYLLIKCGPCGSDIKEFIRSDILDKPLISPKVKNDVAFIW